MGMTVQFFDAGHKYGFDYMPVTSAENIAFSNLIGPETEETTSWGNTTPQIGQPLSITVKFANGFTGTGNFTLTSYSTVSISSISYSRTGTGEKLFTATGTINVSAYNLGDALQDSYYLSGADVINGNAFNNGLKGYAGNDRLDGGGGIDTAYFTGFKSAYQITKSGAATVVSGRDGADTLTNIERLRFDDKTLALDTDGNAGQAYRLYQAAFGRKPDLGGLGVWMNQLDNGQSLEWVSTQFQNSAEFKLKYGTNVSNEQFVTLLYQNVLHRGPDSGGMTAWKGALDAGAQTRSQVLAGFSESTENKIALIGVIQDGMEYIPAA